MEIGVDPRWKQLMEQGADCSCGQRHVGLIDLAFLQPADWKDAPAKEPNENLRMDGDFFSEEFAVRQGKYFAIRCVMPLPIAGCSPPASPLVVWASVEKDSFEKLVAEPRPQLKDPPVQFAARLVNRIGGYPDTLGLMGAAFPMPDSPPLLVLAKNADPEAPMHQLVQEHRDGASFDRLLEVYAAQGHDMRGAFAGTKQ